MLNNTHPPFYTLGLRVALVVSVASCTELGEMSVESSLFVVVSISFPLTSTTIPPFHLLIGHHYLEEHTPALSATTHCVNQALSALAASHSVAPPPGSVASPVPATGSISLSLIAPTGLARAHGRFSAWRAPPLAPALLRLDPPQRQDTALIACAALARAPRPFQRAARSPACTRPSPPESTPATLPPPRGTLPPHALRVYRPALPLRVRHGRFSARRAPPLAPALPRPNPPQRRLPHVHYLGAR
ncbi:hypothetical protein C8F04DRAFT_1295363 [Mycena alexandri]|uniref:Uncharacterized protein n=1 Tax=Mycena alexandri TaxID=1745969 RepID=A0AAD6TA22_9AGAR|nr:hypothetical protein C8F04DRAFT_1295363 [Mycena alexandri]